MPLPLKSLALCLLLALGQGCQEHGGATVQFRNQDGSSSPQITAEIADTPAAEQLGLMYRKEMAPTAGMLFVFPEEKPRTFWMKNTYLELDMIFIDDAKRVVSIVANAVPLTETARPSEKPAKYVLEVRGGSAAAWKITPGSTVEIAGLDQKSQ